MGEKNKISFEFTNEKNIWNLFSDYFGLKLNVDNIFYNWIHKPL